MEIVIHAGLHKSGTTTIQHAWRSSFSQSQQMWYPELSEKFGHHQVAWSYSSGFRSGRVPYLVYRGNMDPQLWTIGELVELANQKGAKRLLISSEEFDHFNQEDCDELSLDLVGHTVTSVFTATRPAHRYFSNWQELVKHGLPFQPQECISLILDLARLADEGFIQLVKQFPGQRKIIRLVRDTPPETDLAASVLKLFSQESLHADLMPEIKNQSIGVRSEILRRLNSEFKTVGILTEQSRLEFLKLSPLTDSEYMKEIIHNFDGVTSALTSAALRESSALIKGGGNFFELSDPLAQIDHWQDLKFPEWINKTYTFSEGNLPLQNKSYAPIDIWKTQLRWAASDEQLKVKLNAIRVERDDALAERERAIADRDAANLERDNALAERERAVAERESILSSRIWRATSFYRKMRKLPREH